MGLMDLFSKRQKRSRNEFPDVFRYDDIPETLRVQVVHIARAAIGDTNDYVSDNTLSAYRAIVQTLRKEYGVFKLPPTRDYENNDSHEIFNFLLSTEDVERALDVIELLFRIIDSNVREFRFAHRHDSHQISDDCIEELNGRFKEAGVGYQFVDGEIIRVDSQLIHSEVVKPALRLLNSQHYKGAHEEFLSAYEHYRHRKNKEALNDCLKSFESTMKAICEKRGWDYDPKDTAKKLIETLFTNELIPSFWQTKMGSLRTLLESSVPTGRNNLSGHGQGSTPVQVPDHITAYMLHMTASTLVFLTTAENALP